MRAPPFRWSWQEIADSTDVQIMVTLAAVARQNKAMKEAMNSNYTPDVQSRVPKGDPKDARYQPSHTDHLTEEEYLKQALPGFYSTARYFCLNPKHPAHKKYLDGMVEAALIKRRARIKKLKEQGSL